MGMDGPDPTRPGGSSPRAGPRRGGHGRVQVKKSIEKCPRGGNVQLAPGRNVETFAATPEINERLYVKIQSKMSSYFGT